MFEETTTKTVKTIKWVWWFLKEELPQFLSNWRTVPRIMMVLYGLVFYNTMTWFMALDAPNNAQAGFVSVVVGAGAAACDSESHDASPRPVGGQGLQPVERRRGWGRRRVPLIIQFRL